MKTINSTPHLRLSGLCRLFLILLAVLFCAFPAANTSAATYQKDLQIDFSFDTSAVANKTVTGYRLYKENTLLCERGPVSPQTITCSDSGEAGTYSFTLAALYNDGTESPKSPAFPFTIGTTTEPPPPAATGSKAFTFTWEYIATSGITAYRFYINDNRLCESTTPSATTITCNAELLNQVMNFSMTSVDSQGLESTRSNILTFNPADYPDLLSQKTATLTWEYTATATPISGFKVYQNDTLVCQTSDAASRQLACTVILASTNAFRVVAVEESGSEITLPTTTVAITGGTTPTSEPLKAVIVTTSQNGQVPFSLSLDGSKSTGAVTSYTWAFGDGAVATGANVSHTYASAGTYTATLTVADASGLTRQSSMALTVTAGNIPPLTPPVASLSSSSAVGNAPFTVQFDGSGSTSAQPPIVSYVWDFGDGASAEGAAVAHTFTTPGTYHTLLTITDSVGVTGQASTPVIINAPPPQVNQVPLSSFTASTPSGKSPLTVTFNASGSNDPDGFIKEYTWSFGDGASATGVSPSHTFAEAGDFVVSLYVVDDQGATSVSSLTISVMPADDIDFEVMEVQLDHNWTKFSFNKPYVNPVVVAGPPSYADAAPAVVRFRNITPLGYEARIQEWNYLDGKHAFEKLSIIIMEKGIYTLSNGTKIEAGTFTGTTAFQKITLQQSYAVIPVILAQVATYNETDAITGRMRNSTATSFEYRMQEQEKNKNSHAAETISYIAWEPSQGEHAGLIYETGFTKQSVTHNWFSLTFKKVFLSRPFFMAGMQTYGNADTATVRTNTFNQNAILLKIEEEQSKDIETTHPAEVLGYLSIIGAP